MFWVAIDLSHGFAFLFLLQGCRTFCWCLSYGSMLTGESIHTPINVLVVLGI